MDTSCLMHIGGALQRQRAGVRTMHLAEILAAQDVNAPTSSAIPRRAGMTSTGFPTAAKAALADAQLRRNLGKATTAIRAKRERAVAELDDWEALRDAGAALKARAMATLPELLEQLEAARHRGRRHRPLGARRRGGQRDRRRHRPRARRGRGHQGQVARHRRDRAQRGARAARASQRSRPTSPS